MIRSFCKISGRQIRGTLLTCIVTLLTGCYSIKQSNRITSVNLHYSDFRSRSKDVRFAEMTMVGKKRFFENAVRLTELSKQQGYVLFYEHLDFRNTGDTIMRKVRHIAGFIPDFAGYNSVFKPAVENGFVIYDPKLFIGKINNFDSLSDITPDELVDAYEQRFGEIVLKQKDFDTPLDKTRLSRIHSGKADKIMIDYRNQRLADAIQSSPSDKILVLYGARHRKGLFRELTSRDSSYFNVNRYSTQRDTNFDHSLQPDTLRQIVQSGWIEQMGSHIGVKLGFHNDIESFLVDTDDLDFEILPNTSVKAKLSVNYRFLSFSFSYEPSFIPGNDDEELRGKTTSNGIGMNFTFSHWFQGLSYQRTKGYYLNNSNELDPTWESGDPYFQVPELVYQCFQGTTGYSFNPKFSVASLTSQTERQLRSAGTFTPQLHYRYYIIDDTKELTPGASSQKTNNIEGVIAAGYHHTFVIHQSWYINAGSEFGIGYLNTHLETRGAQESSTTQDNFVFRWDARAGLGYNGKRLFAGGFGTASGSSFQQENTTAINVDTRIYYQLFVGFRVSAPKFLRQRFE